MRTGVIVAARMGSSRMPGKVLEPLCGLPLIAFLLQRLRQARFVDEIIVATSHRSENDPLVEIVADTGTFVFRGDEEDVVARFVKAATTRKYDRVVRVTGDCPLVDGRALDYVLEKCDAGGAYDLATTKSRFPVGIDFEVYGAETMRQLHENAPLTKDDREHLTMHMVRQPETYRHLEISPPDEWVWSGAPFTVDTPEDFHWVGEVAERAGGVGASVAELVAAARDVSKSERRTPR